jgi:hypothetical protein
VARIAILTHAHDVFANYFLTEIAHVWREQRHEITLHPGPTREARADLAIVHVDLTVVPPEYLASARQFGRAINANVPDISKRIISRQLVARGDDYDGPVIVKTNRNCGGLPEAKLARKGLIPGGMACKPEDYPIFQFKRMVSEKFWDNPEFVVEKFLYEQRDGHFCLRTWVFLGDRETNSLSYSKSAIVKSNNVIRREPVAEVPDELRAMRREFGFDYGKFDYAIVDGRVVLYDVNRTPTLGRFSREQFMPRIRLLAEGLDSFLK